MRLREAGLSETEINELLEEACGVPPSNEEDDLLWAVRCSGRQASCYYTCCPDSTPVNRATVETSMVKYFASEMVGACYERGAAKILGGAGYTTLHPV